MDEEAKFWMESEDDNLCIEVVEALENSLEWQLLHDGQDNVFENLDVLPEVPINANVEPNNANIEQISANDEPRWSDAVRISIENAYQNSALGRSYLNEHFFCFEQWPSYMVELFILNNIAMYTYSARNKICLFFWGNGATLDVMMTLSELFAPPINRSTDADRRRFHESIRKCEGLFETYRNNCLNPAYSQRYYYYNMIERKMLYIDGRPRHHGRRQEDVNMDAVPEWARIRNNRFQNRQ